MSFKIAKHVLKIKQTCNFKIQSNQYTKGSEYVHYSSNRENETALYRQRFVIHEYMPFKADLTALA
jgi:hypothetical protein